MNAKINIAEVVLSLSAMLGRAFGRQKPGEGAWGFHGTMDGGPWHATRGLLSTVIDIYHSVMPEPLGNMVAGRPSGVAGRGQWG